MALPSGRRNWAADILRAAGLPATKNNLTLMSAWQEAEGGTASNNPLNTTQPWQGSSNYNSVGVKHYPSWGTGVAATAKTMKNGYYDRVLALMRKSASPMEVAQAIQASPWGTKHVVDVLQRGGYKVPDMRTDVADKTLKTGSLGFEPLSLSGPSVERTADLIGFVMANNQLLSQGMQPTAPLTFKERILPPVEAPDTPTFDAPAVDPGVETMNDPGGPRRGALAEAFYDPLGQWDNGRFSPKGIGGHSDHVHLSVTDAKSMIAAIRQARKMGLDPRENLYSENVDPVHTEGSFHYQTFPGRYDGRQLSKGVDVSGNPNAMAAYFRWALTNLR